MTRRGCTTKLRERREFGHRDRDAVDLTVAPLDVGREHAGAGRDVEAGGSIGRALGMRESSGTGPGLDLQRREKECPVFAAEYAAVRAAAVGTRTQRPRPDIC